MGTNAKFVYTNSYLLTLFKPTPLSGHALKTCETNFIPIVTYSEDS